MTQLAVNYGGFSNRPNKTAIFHPILFSERHMT